MSEFLDHLESDLVRAGKRLRHRGRRPWRSLTLSTVICVGVGAATAGGTLVALRGSVIPSPEAKDVPSSQLAAPGSAHLVSLRAADPAAGQPPWALRLSKSVTGQTCSTVGQVEHGRFGLVGLDHRFRVLPERVIDGCGVTRPNTVSLTGVRVFDAAARSDVRSVVFGVAGPTLRAVTLTTGADQASVPIKDGTFVASTRGYPEDSGLLVKLRFADGHVEQRAFGRSPNVVQSGGGAWKTEIGAVGGAPGRRPDPRLCVQLRSARENNRPAVSRAACGIPTSVRKQLGLWWRVSKEPSGAGPKRSPFAEHWNGNPPQTAVWGYAGKDVARITVTAPGQPPQRARIGTGSGFTVVYAPTVDPRRVTVTANLVSGQTITRHGNYQLEQEPTR